MTRKPAPVSKKRIAVGGGKARARASELDRHDEPVHLLLTDVVLPGVGGRALADRITERRPEIRVLFASGYTDDAILRRGVLDKGAHFIGKPYTISELTRKVRQVLDS